MTAAADTPESRHVDVAVAGGGMVGATLAALLGREGLRVAVVEAQPPAPTPLTTTPDLRVSSINRGSAALIERAGAWQRIGADALCPFRQVAAWSEHGGSVTFDAAEAGVDALGWFVENRVLVGALHATLETLPTVQWLAPASPESITPREDGITIELDCGGRIDAGLLVAADGAGSRVRTLADIPVQRHDYGLRALITNVTTTLPQQDITWQRFTDTGPQGFLPLHGPRASLVWYGDPDTVRTLESLDDAHLATTIMDEFPDELGGVEAVLDRASFAIGRQHAARYVDARVALVGDAAHSIHPLAGQGLNLGLQGVASLVQAILAAHEESRDPGTGAALAAYERAHRPRVLAMMAATETMHRLFTGGPVGGRLGTAALIAAARAPRALRRAVVRHASGLDSLPTDSDTEA